MDQLIFREYIASVDAALRGDSPSPAADQNGEFALMGVLQGALEEEDLETYQLIHLLLNL